MLWEIKPLAYSYVYEFDVVLEKGVESSKEKNDLDPPALDQTILLMRQKLRRSIETVWPWNTLLFHSKQIWQWNIWRSWSILIGQVISYQCCWKSWKKCPTFRFDVYAGAEKRVMQITMNRNNDPEKLSNALSAVKTKNKMQEPQWNFDCCNTKTLFELNEFLKGSIGVKLISHYCQKESKGKY